MIEYLLLFIGIPYVYGGNNPMAGFDCSGLICEGLRSVGVIGREDLRAAEIHAKMLGRPGSRVVERDNIARNDLLFFGSQKITHVAVAINDYQMIEAGGGNSKTKTKELAEKKNAFVRIRPIQSRSDLLSAVRWVR